MKKTVMLCSMLLALAMMTACKSGARDNDTVFENEFNDSVACHGGFEYDWQLMLLGEWKAVQLNRTKTISGKDVTETVTPKFLWRIDDNGFYYETGYADGDSITMQYSYFLKNDSLMLREDNEPGISPWFVIDSLLQDKLVLISVDSIKGGTTVNTLTLKRIK
jgi:hypothetical protein